MRVCERIRCAVLVAAVWTLAGGALAPLAAAEPADDVAALIARLKAPKFIDRELATEALVGKGAAVVEPLVAALKGQNHEVTGRIVRVLRELSIGGDPAAEEVAVAALERLATVPPSPILGQRALAALDSIQAFRQERAVSLLKLAGAEFPDEGTVKFGAAGRIMEVPTQQVVLGPGWKGGEKELKQLRCLFEHNHIVLSGPTITEECLDAVRMMPGLEFVEIKRTKLKDASLTKLRGVKQLQLLGIYYTPISDASLDLLQALPVAVEFKLYGTEISAAGADRLQSALVGAGVDFKRGAFVGIGTMNFAADCEVNTVMRGSAAEKAGIELGDIVVGYNGQPVTDFDSFRKLINQTRAGEKVPIVVLRDGERITKMLELGEWE